jgi:hypothetical protein
VITSCVPVGVQLFTGGLERVVESLAAEPELRQAK